MKDCEQKPNKNEAFCFRWLKECLKWSGRRRVASVRFANSKNSTCYSTEEERAARSSDPLTSQVSSSFWPPTLKVGKPLRNITTLLCAVCKAGNSADCDLEVIYISICCVGVHQKALWIAVQEMLYFLRKGECRRSLFRAIGSLHIRGQIEDVLPSKTTLT